MWRSAASRATDAKVAEARRECVATVTGCVDVVLALAAGVRERQSQPAPLADPRPPPLLLLHECMPACCDLCAAVERVLTHELKARYMGNGDMSTLWNYVNKTQQGLKLCREAVEFCEYTERVAACESLVADFDRGRAWVRVCLNALCAVDERNQLLADIDVVI